LLAKLYKICLKFVVNCRQCLQNVWTAIWMSVCTGRKPKFDFLYSFRHITATGSLSKPFPFIFNGFPMLRVSLGAHT